MPVNNIGVTGHGITHLVSFQIQNVLSVTSNSVVLLRFCLSYLLSLTAGSTEGMQQSYYYVIAAISGEQFAMLVFMRILGEQVAGEMI